MYQLSSEIQRTYVKMVQERKKEKKNSNYVEQCKDYLTQNFHKRITAEELAKQIGVNRSYLSGKFSEQVGMSISQYSILIRIRAAENMLKYSEASISYILAESLKRKTGFLRPNIGNRIKIYIFKQTDINDKKATYMTETSIGYGYDNRIQWMFFIAKHINNWFSEPILIA